MRKAATRFVLAGVLLAGGATAQSRKQQDIDLQAAIRTQNVDGDLTGAIQQYRAIVSKYTEDRAVMAMALVHMADCYRKMGDAEAQKIYERVVRDFADQKEAVARARPNLGSTGGLSSTLVWLDREGREHPSPAPPRPYLSARLSPDGQRAAVAIGAPGGQCDIWVYDLQRATLTRLTFQGDRGFPIWAPDGQRITFRSTNVETATIFSLPADGSGPPEPLLAAGADATPTSWSPDGKLLAFHQGGPRQRNIWLWGGPEPKPFVETQFNEYGAEFSPDGRWIAYASNESGRLEIYLRPAPGVGPGKWQVSALGGTMPRWARSGQELFYLDRDRVMVVAFEGSPTVRVGVPRALLEGIAAGGDYDVSPDGKRFLFIKRAAP